MPEDKSSSPIIDLFKAFGGISAIGVLKEFLKGLVEDFMGLNGTAGRITAFWLVFILVALLLGILDYSKDKKSQEPAYSAFF